MNNKVKFVLITWLTAVLLMAPIHPTATRADAGQQGPGIKPQKSFVRGRVLVQFYADVEPGIAHGLVSTFGGRSAKKISGAGIHVVELPPGISEEFYMQTLKSRAEVEFAELDHIYPLAQMTPNDPEYGSAWHLPRISTPAAWSVTTGSASVTIAILDTGVHGTHPDLAAKMVPGWNAFDNNANSADVHGHGTMVAGTAAAASNNSLGVASIAWGCSIMPVRVSDPYGYAFSSTISAGLTWAAEHGARVANVSYQMSTSSAVQSAARYFRSRGGVVALAAGNDAWFDPARDIPEILTVSATTSADTLASWSNTGNLIDLAAPGVSIRTTTRSGGYASPSGTSFAAPIVAGVAALVLSANPTLTPDQVQNVLKQSADDLGPAGWDTTFGAGRVNAANAVNRALASQPPPNAPPSVVITSPSPGAAVSGRVSVYVNATDDRAVTKVELYVDGARVATSTAAPFTNRWDARRVASGSHTLQCRAYDGSNNVTLSAPVTVQVLR